MGQELKNLNERSLKLTERLLNNSQVTRTEVSALDISFKSILRSSEPNFNSIVKRGDSEKLTRTIAVITTIFMTDNFPDHPIADISINFANQIIKREPTWEIGDVVNFFNFIQMRQDLPELKIFGNKITPIRLMEMVATYNEHRAIAHEELLAEQKSKTQIPTQREYDDKSVKALMGKELEKVQVANDDEKISYQRPADETYFNQNPISKS